MTSTLTYPSKEELRSLFYYRRGHLYWRSRPASAFRSYSAYMMWNKRYAEKPAGSRNPRGYIKIAISKKHYMAHRLIWLYHKGWLPEALDHKNGNPSDNRLGNLRAATQMENRWNSRRRQKTSTNVKGLYLRDGKYYEAHVCTNYKRYYIGRFIRKSDAIKRIREVREALHKEFASHS